MKVSQGLSYNEILLVHLVVKMKVQKVSKTSPDIAEIADCSWGELHHLIDLEILHNVNPLYLGITEKSYELIKETEEQFKTIVDKIVF